MNFQQIVSLVVFISISEINSQKLTNVVQIHSGPIQGVILKNVLSQKEYSAFKGVPYAKPPLGANRFLPPVEPEPWTVVLPAVEHRNICAQLKNDKLRGSEDCLYLNVYTSEINFSNITELKPVMVWIHGGAFVMGRGDSDKYGPDFIVDKDVVLVTFNYRLGSLGFMNLQHPQIPGNAGLKDQNYVLQWVQKNIIKFGGDPRSVTLFGQSAGAVSVDLHTISDMSKSLFHKSVAMSGSVFCPWAFHTAEEAKSNAFRFGQKVTTKNFTTVDELVNILLEVPIETLTKEVFSFLTVDEYMDLKIPFAPSVEKPGTSDQIFIDECFIEKYLKGSFHTGPHVSGYTNMEAAVALSYISKSVAQLVDRIGQLFQTQAESRVDDDIQEETFLTVLLKLYTEALFAVGIDLKQRYMLRYGKPESIYYYYFTFDMNMSKYIDGVRHSEDLQYIFYKVRKNQSLEYFDSMEIPENANSFAVTRNRVVKMFTNFAKVGNPTPNPSDAFLSTTWTPTTSLGGFLDIGLELTMKPSSRPLTNRALKQEESLDSQFSNHTCKPILVF